MVGMFRVYLVRFMSIASTAISPNEVDCDSDIDPQVSNEDYCSGYQHGFADTTNELLTK
jgi:hypothetical protein